MDKSMFLLMESVMVKEIFTQKSGSFTTTPQHELSEFKIELAEEMQGLQEALLSKACQGTHSHCLVVEV